MIKSKITPPRVIKQFVPRLNPSFVLDIGCGEGALTRYFCDVWPSAFILGIDVDTRMLKIAKNFLGLDVILAEGCNLPLNSKTANFIINNQVIEHVQSDKDLLDEIGRVLNDRGLLYITSIAKSKKLYLDTDIFEKSSHTGRAHPHVRSYLSLEQFISLLNAKTFSTKIAFTQRHSYPIFDIISRILCRLLRVKILIDKILIICCPSIIRLINVPVFGYDILYVLAIKEESGEA